MLLFSRVVMVRRKNRRAANYVARSPPSHTTSDMGNCCTTTDAVKTGGPGGITDAPPSQPPSDSPPQSDPAPVPPQVACGWCCGWCWCYICYSLRRSSDRHRQALLFVCRCCVRLLYRVRWAIADLCWTDFQQGLGGVNNISGLNPTAVLNHYRFYTCKPSADSRGTLHSRYSGRGDHRHTSAL